jgi:GxxExxY protein
MVETRSTFDDPQTYAIVGAGMAVHRELGCGFLEHVYQEAFTIELRHRSIPFVREAAISVKYRGHVLPVLYKLDFMCYGAVAVELKALRAIWRHELSAQATRARPGLGSDSEMKAKSA